MIFMSRYDNINRLKNVTDSATKVSYTGATDFNDGADEDVEYEYDDNGNIRDYFIPFNRTMVYEFNTKQ